MAPTLNGTTRWPDARRLTELGQVRANLTKKDIDGILEATADGLNDTLPKLKRYFRESEFSEIGKHIAAAWEEGIRETLQLPTKAAGAGKQKQSNGKRGPAASEIAIVESLRKKRGQFTGPQRLLADELKIPLSTLNTAIRRLEARELLRRFKKSLVLVER